MTKRHLFTASTVGVICALAGATAGIAESSATTRHTTADTVTIGWADLFGPSVGRGLGFGAFDAIHSVSIETNGNGGFETVTVDAGTVTQAGTNSVTIKEGSSNATYASPTITPHGKLTVTLDGKPSTLSALATGDRVIVAQSSAGTNRVTALDSSATSTTWNGGPSDGGPDQSGSGWQGYGTAGAWHGSVNEYGPPSAPGGAQGW
jgi:hypothetical protein